jgi:cytochrome c oxidase subunit I
MEQSGRIAVFVYAVGATACGVATVGPRVATWTGSWWPVGHRLISEELFDTIQRQHVGFTMLMVVLPFALALSHATLAPLLHEGTIALRSLTSIGAATWAAGAVLASAQTVGVVDGGWFLYAPNSGVIFAPDGHVLQYVRAPLLMSVGLGVSTLCLLITYIRRGRHGGRSTRPGIVWSGVAFHTLVLLVASWLTVDLIRFAATRSGHVPLT